MADSDDDLPLAARMKAATTPAKPASADESDDDKPLAARKSSSQKKRKARSDEGDDDSDSESREAPRRRSGGGGGRSRAQASSSKKEILWQTLQHQGVLFPPPYEPHGIKLLYAGVPVDLSPAEEEVATFFAAMKETDYAVKEKFIANFWNGFQDVLSSKNKKLIKEFKKCDFSLIYAWCLEEREKKKAIPNEEKKRLKAERDAAELKYTTAVLNGKVEKIGNFRVEPPGLFRGRGEHPKMGLVKKRIMPEDVIINIGEEAVVPPPPAGHSWKEVKHDKTVSWLAGWKDTVNTKDWKYVQFAAVSSVKGESDVRKYERARKLKDVIAAIREDYNANMQSPHMQTAQLAVTTYLVDKLALRAGGEKGDDEADTVGVCTLRVGHVTCEEPNTLKFDFLGKDSIRYQQDHEVPKEVFKAIQRFCEGKKPEKDVFDEIDPQIVNDHLKTLMPELTIKVFRTYNASITLSRQLKEFTVDSADVPAKKAVYDLANKAVAILCNHQRGVSKAHDVQMQKMEEKKAALEADIANAKGPTNALNERLRKLQLLIASKEELKTVSLGTSKINYLDPRITISWCKRHEVPITVVFPRALLEKFNWAMEVEPEFEF